MIKTNIESKCNIIILAYIFNKTFIIDKIFIFDILKFLRSYCINFYGTDDWSMQKGLIISFSKKNNVLLFRLISQIWKKIVSKFNMCTCKISPRIWTSNILQKIEIYKNDLGGFLGKSGSKKFLTKIKSLIHFNLITSKTKMQ